MVTPKTSPQPCPRKDAVDQRHFAISATGLLKFGVTVGWKAITGLTKFAFKIPGMFVRANRRNTTTRNTGILLLLFLSTQFLQGCAAVEGIFKAGVWVGVIAVVAVVGIIIFIVSKIAGGGKS
jgi:hypothetical protein